MLDYYYVSMVEKYGGGMEYKYSVINTEYVGDEM